MEQLNLPKFPFKIIIENNVKKIFDPFRKKFIKLTPEEWVRQHIAKYLINEKNFPESLIAIEREVIYNGLSKRFDILVFDKKGNPNIIVECKAPSIKINQKVFDQAAVYAFALAAKYILVSNGFSHYCFLVNRETETFLALKEIPDFTKI
jgi:Type I restriction enzyme R protein N terminus (HSDR_N)